MPIKNIVEGGEVKGFLASQYYANPFPFHYLKSLEIAPESQNQGKGASLLSDFTRFLTEKGACGILFNAAEDKVKNIYENSGWKELLSHPGRFVFNLPGNLDQSQLDETISTLEII